MLTTYAGAKTLILPASAGTATQVLPPRLIKYLYVRVKTPGAKVYIGWWANMKASDDAAITAVQTVAGAITGTADAYPMPASAPGILVTDAEPFKLDMTAGHISLFSEGTWLVSDTASAKVEIIALF